MLLHMTFMFPYIDFIHFEPGLKYIEYVFVCNDVLLRQIVHVYWIHLSVLPAE